MSTTTGTHSKNKLFFSKIYCLTNNVIGPLNNTKNKLKTDLS